MDNKKYGAVMLIDDNEADILVNKKVIENAAITDHIYLYTGAKSAIEFLKNIEQMPSSQNILPDLIFLDIDMPLMDGMQFLEEFEKFPEGIKNKSNIVILTSSGNSQDFNEFRKYKNVTTFLNKPLSPEKIKTLYT